MESISRAVSKKTVIGAIALVALVGAFCLLPLESTEFNSFRLKTPVEKSWEAWKIQFNRTYGGPEEKVRFNVFKKNQRIIEEHNAKNLSWTMELNKFSDLTNKEFAALYTGARRGLKNSSELCQAPSDSSKLLSLPATLDWRTQGRVGAVKNQAQCGSCWAFSTTGALEGLASKDGKAIPSYSEQQLVDCSTSYGNQGCGGGWVQWAFQYVHDKGITTEDAYPYKGVDGTCKDSQVKSAFTINNCANVAVQSVDALKEALQTGPVSVYVEADTAAFQSYKTGIVTGAACFVEGEIDHAVLAVGYTEKSWIVKNSWATSWGDAGYIQIDIDNSADQNGVCGILSTPNTYPL